MLPRHLVRPVAITLAAIAAVLAVVAIVYLTTKASQLPGFMPGHIAKRVGKKGHVLPTHTHAKLGVVLFLAAIGAAVGAWWVAFRYRPAGHHSAR